MKIIFLSFFIFIGQVFINPALAQSSGAHVGDFYCQECDFVGAGMPYTPSVSTFIRYGVNPYLQSGSWLLPNGTRRTVTICNGSTCATYQYMANGTHIQITPEFEDTHETDDYTNSSPPNTSPPGGGGGGGGGSSPYYPPLPPPGCYGEGCGGTVVVGPVTEAP